MILMFTRIATDGSTKHHERNTFRLLLLLADSILLLQMYKIKLQMYKNKFQKLTLSKGNLTDIL